MAESDDEMVAWEEDDEVPPEDWSEEEESEEDDEDIEVVVTAGEVSSETTKDYMSGPRRKKPELLRKKTTSIKRKKRISKEIYIAETVLACARLKAAAERMRDLSTDSVIETAFPEPVFKSIKKSQNLKLNLKVATQALNRRHGREHADVNDLRLAVVSNRRLSNAVFVRILGAFFLRIVKIEIILFETKNDAWLQVGPYFCTGSAVSKEGPPVSCLGISLEKNSFFCFHGTKNRYLKYILPKLNIETKQPIHTNLPRTRTDFVDHPRYVLNPLKAAIKQNEKPYTYFEGKPVYCKSQVNDIRSERKWRLDLRSVKPNEKPIWGALYSYEQTEAWQPAPCLNDTIPTNKHGNVDIVDGDPRLIPPNTVWIQHARALQHCRKANIPHAPVITGFSREASSSSSSLSHSHSKKKIDPTPSLYRSAATQSSGFSSLNYAKPIKKGVVVPSQYADEVKALLLSADQHRISLAHKLRRRKLAFRWATLVSKSLSRARLDELYLPS